MKIISHRGNTKGKNPQLENCPDYIIDTLKLQFDVEIDLRCIENKLYLGHDNGQYEINENFLYQKGLWIHAKNLAAVEYLLNTPLNYFWHQTDDFAITSNRFVWTYPNKSVIERSIIVDLNQNWKTKHYNCYGVCVDWV